MNPIEKTREQLLKENQELENQIVELKKQNEIFRMHSLSHKDKEKSEDIENYSLNILNNISDPVFVKDDQSRLLLVNDSFCEIFDLVRDKIIGKTLAEDVPDEERESFLKIDKQVLSDGIENINEESLTVRGGQTRIISTKKSRFIDSNGDKFLIGIIRDISDRKQAEIALQKSEDKLSKTLIAANDGTWDWNLITNEINFDPQYYKMAGYEVNEFPQVIQEFQKRVHPEDVEYVFTQVQKHLEGETDKYQVEFRFQKKNGSWLWIMGRGLIVEQDENNKPLRFIGTHRDITELKQTEEALRESEKNLLEAQRIAKIGRWELNIISNKLNWSPTIYDIFEIDSSKFEASYEGFLESIHPDDREKVNTAYIESLKTKLPYTIEHRLLMKDGRIKWVTEICETYFDKNGQALRSVGIVHDITERKQTEIALKDSKEKFHTIADFSYDWEYWINPQDEFIYISPSCERITGYSPNEFKQNPELLTSIVHPDDVNNWENHKHNVLDKAEIETIEFRIITKNGEECWIGHVCQTIYDANGVNIGIRGSNRDITDKKLVEFALQESEELLSLFINSATDGFTLWSSNLHLLKINRIGLSIFPKGTKMEDLIGKSMLELIPNLKKTGRHDKYLEVIETGEPFLIEDFVPHPKFGDVHLSIRAFKVGEGLGIMSENITDRKKAQQALQESKQKFESMILNSPDLIMSQNTNSKIEYISPQCEKILGYTAEEIKNIDIKKLFPPDEIEKTRKTELRTLGGVEINNFEYRFFKKNGDVVWLDHTARPIIVDGKITEILSTVRDITERKNIDMTLQEHAQELQERNEDLDAFSHTVAHDLKNPLANIIGFADMLSEDYKNIPEDQAKLFINAIVKSGEKTQEIINSLLLLASVRKAEIKTTKINMGGIVKETLERLSPMILKNNAKVTFSETWPTAIAYSPWIEEVLINYLSNAIKYGGTPPVIEIGYDTVKTKDASKKRVRFWVKDDGSGISAKNQTLLFRKFERLDQVKTEGYGLGLSIVERIIEKLEGDVGLESELGKGSKFYFTLPLAD